MICPSGLNKGMTLVEVLVAIGISVVVMSAVATFEVNVFKYQRDISSSFTTTQDAQVVMRTMAKELRTASPSATGSYTIAQADNNALTFFTDLKGDGIKDRIRYTLMDNKIYRAKTTPTGSPLSYDSAVESTTTLVHNVKNDGTQPVFEYFDNNYDGSQSALIQPVTLTAIRFIKINVFLHSGNNQSTTTKLYSTGVALRNLKDNL